MAQIPKAFKPLLNECLNLDTPTEDSKIYWVYYSGRGTGKSENIAAILILAMFNRPNTRVVCIREVQHSIQESVKATLERWIDEFDLYTHFHVTGSTLRCKNGSEAFFIGLKNSNSPNIKSISNVNITFIEEASQLSEKSWRLLVPSVTRVKNPKIIIAFNPDREDDIIYKEFVANTPPKSSSVKRLTWEDNPFFANSSLYDVMLDDKERLPYEVFAHIWEGELAKNVEDSLFKKANFTPITSPEVYTQIVIGVDPATTNNEFSNEYGVIVAAKTNKGEIRILQDYTAKYTPREFSSKVVEAYYEHNASTIVVETNQGGDFIKSAILDIDANVHIVEVRAGTSKHQRALPLANMMEIGTLRFTDNFAKLRRQMELTTLRGYLGPRGESPDALDAAIWAVYYLMDMHERDSLYKVFRPSYFDKLISNYLESKELYYATCNAGVYYLIAVKGIYNGSEKQLYVTSSAIKEKIEDLNIRGTTVCPDTPNNYTLIQRLNAISYMKERVKLDERVSGLLHLFKANKVFIGDSNDSYKNHSGNMLLIALGLYTYEEDRETDYLIDLFCDIILQEFNI